MTTPDPDTLEANFASALAALDETLASGTKSPTPQPADPILRQRLSAAEGSLRRLEKSWPRTAAHTPLPNPYGDAHLPLLLPGQRPVRFGRFLLRRELGRGGFGIVYL